MPPEELFTRTTRIIPPLPQEDIDIVSPGNLPSLSPVSLLTILLPVGGTVIGFGLMIWMNASTRGGSLVLSLGISLPMMLATYTATILTYVNQRKRYRQAVQDREQKYKKYLGNMQTRLLDLQKQYLQGYMQIHPTPAECTARVSRRVSRLWERSPGDKDFLHLRLGTGAQKMRVNLRLPVQDPTQDPDPLITEARYLEDRLTVAHAPVILPVVESGISGLAGPRSNLLNLARALIIQAATHHSPDEVKIVAMFSESERDAWDWVRWLPHTWRDDHKARYLADSPESAHALFIRLEEELQGRKRWLDHKSDSSLPLPVLLIFLPEPRLLENETILPLLIKDGPRLGAFPIFFASRKDGLPKGCKTIIEYFYMSTQMIRTGKDNKAEYTPFEPDVTPVDLADRTARLMSSIRMKRVKAAGEIPTVVTLMDILQVDQIENFDAAAAWALSRPEESLSVPVGARSGGQLFYLDLHEPNPDPRNGAGHGPNGLVAGTVGSGKSELLQALVLSLAARYSPREVAFVLLDFKGGSTAGPLQGLPHLINTITNLEIDYVPRALVSLEAEIERRETLFKRLGVTHIDEYVHLHRINANLPDLPYLVLIVDEFTVLRDRRPDDMSKFVTVAVKGRSLGFRMILATQRPAGVVSDQIDANTQFRICLRVARTEDSSDVLKHPDAVKITIPGRAYMRVGDDVVFDLFQSAWCGAPYRPGSSAGNLDDIAEVALDGSLRALNAEKAGGDSYAAPKQIKVVVEYLRQSAERSGIQPLPGLWMPPLPRQVQLQEVRPARGWDGTTWQPHTPRLAPVVGLLDNPRAQQQSPLVLDLTEDGHFAIFGGPSSGKTTFLHTLITSLLLDHSPEELTFYMLDYGSRSLVLFQSFPQVGGVLCSEETIQLRSLIRYLVRQIENRKQRFTAAGLEKLDSYHSLTGENIARIVLVIDNYPMLVKAHPEVEDVLTQIAQEGGKLGIHLVLTAGSPGQIKYNLMQLIAGALAFQLADRTDYVQAVGPIPAAEPAPFPGRGLLRGKPPLEFQAALPVQADDDTQRSTALQTLARGMREAAGSLRAHPIPVIPQVICLPDVKQIGGTGRFHASFGFDMDEAEPFSVGLEQGPHFIISGSTQSGKTTLMQSWLLALSSQYPASKLLLYLVDFSQESFYNLHALPHAAGRYVTNGEEFNVMLEDVGQLMRDRREFRESLRRSGMPPRDVALQMVQYPAVAIALDDHQAYNALPVKTRETFERLVASERGLGLHILLSAPTSDLNSQGILRILRETPAGFLLGTTEQSMVGNFKTQIPSSEANRLLPAGEGLLVIKGQARKVKIATAWEGSLTLPEWVRQIQEKEQAVSSF